MRSVREGAFFVGTIYLMGKMTFICHFTKVDMSDVLNRSFPKVMILNAICLIQDWFLPIICWLIIAIISERVIKGLSRIKAVSTYFIALYATIAISILCSRTASLSISDPIYSNTLIVYFYIIFSIFYHTTIKNNKCDIKAVNETIKEASYSINCVSNYKNNMVLSEIRRDQVTYEEKIMIDKINKILLSIIENNNKRDEKNVADNQNIKGSIKKRTRF